MSDEQGLEITHTYCQICEQLCGLEVTARQGEILTVKPDRDNPYSWRDFCIKGSTSGQSVSHPQRVRTPLRRTADGRFEPATYEEAITDIAARLTAIIKKDGRDAIADYLGNPGAISYNNSAFNNAFFSAIGTRNRYYVGSLDHNAHLLVAREMYGSPAAALQTEVDDCDCLLLIGANPAISGMSWLGRVPDGWNRILRRLNDEHDLIIIDPRRSETAQKATLHLAPYPESDWAILLAMIQIILAENWEDQRDCARATNFEALKTIAFEKDWRDLSAYADVPAENVYEAARRFATARTAACIARTGPAQGRNGAITEWLAQSLNVIAGRIDKPGCRFFPTFPFNPLAKAPLAPPMQPSRVRGLKPLEGTYSIAELPDEILTPGEGQIRALFINGGNPVVTGPDGNHLDRALASLELLVSIDLFVRESHHRSHWIIPGQHFLERDEIAMHMFPSCDERYIRCARPAVPAPAGVKPEWEFFRDLATAMGLELFSGKADPHPFDLVRQTLALSGELTVEEILASEHGIHQGRHQAGHFHQSLKTQDGQINVCPEAFAGQLREELARIEAARLPDRFQIITRRSKHMMNSWLVETTAKAIRRPRSDSVEIATQDADRLGISDGDQVWLVSDTGRISARAVVSEEIRPGVLVIEHGWGSGFFDPERNTVISREGINRNLLVSRDDLDPLTGVPRLNGTFVTMHRSVVEA